MKRNTKKSPFIYGKTVKIKAFTNRENEIKKLYENLTSGINKTIISPRRWGKSIDQLDEQEYLIELGKMYQVENIIS